MKIVKFKDGKYAIRQGIFIYNYVDLKVIDIYWHDLGCVNNYCKGTYKQVLEVFEKLNDYGQEVKQ
jgi:hypothetical protein